MVLNVDAVTHRRLMLAKQLYQHAIVLSNSTVNETNRLLAAIVFDNAIETLIKCVYSSLEPGRAPATDFQALVNQCSAALKTKGLDELPDVGNIQWVHSIRNDAQHKAKFPTVVNISDARTYTRDFVQKLISQVYGISFASISLADLIQCDEIRKHLQEAEKKLQQYDFVEAVKGGGYSLAYAMIRVQRVFVGEVYPHLRHIVVDKGRGMEDDTTLLRSFDKVQKIVTYMVLGIHYPDYQRFQSITGNVVFYLNGNVGYNGMKDLLEQEDAEYAVSYATKTVLQMEDVVGDIEAPFNKDWRRY